MTQPDERQQGVPAHEDPAGQSHRPQGSPDRGGRNSLLLALPGIFLTMAFFPVGIAVAFALDVAAIVVGARALSRAGRRRSKAPGAVTGIVLGAIGLLFAVFLAAVLAIFWPEVSAFRECVSAANTIQARENCMTTLEHGMERRLGLDP